MTQHQKVLKGNWTGHLHGLYGTPRAWAHKGELLFHAFEAIVAETDPESFHLNMLDQALMLAGMSVESMLKAIILKDTKIRDVVKLSRKPTDKNDLANWNRFYSHDLLKLAQLAKVSLNKGQRKVTSALGQFIVWRGRYVVPKESNVDDLIPVKQDDGLTGQSHRAATVESTRELIFRINCEVKARLYGEGS